MLKRFLLLSTCLGFLTCFCSTSDAAERLPEFRVWHHSDGREAELALIERNDDTAVFVTPGGKEFQVPVSALAPKDRKEVASSEVNFQVWHHIDGRSARLSLVSVRRDYAEFLRLDGDKATIALDQLSIADQKRIADDFVGTSIVSNRSVVPMGTPLVNWTQFVFTYLANQPPVIQNDRSVLSEDNPDTASLRKHFKALAPGQEDLLARVTGQQSAPIDQLAQGLSISPETAELTWKIERDATSPLSREDKNALKLFLCQTVLQKLDLQTDTYEALVQFNPDAVGPAKYGWSPEYVSTNDSDAVTEVVPSVTLDPVDDCCTPVYACGSYDPCCEPCYSSCFVRRRGCRHLRRLSEWNRRHASCVCW